jgi:hypothetical protein
MIDLIKREIRLVALIAVAIILLVVCIWFLTQWMSLTDDKDALETQRMTAEVNLGITRAQYDLDVLRAEEAELLRSPEFPSSFPIVNLSLFFAEGTTQTRVTLVEIEPPVQIGTEVINGKSYPAYETKVTVTGTLNQIVAFLKYLEGGAFTSLKVTDLSIIADTAEFTVVVISQS